jgi:hypothetical protein
MRTVETVLDELMSMCHGDGVISVAYGDDPVTHNRVYELRAELLALVGEPWHPVPGPEMPPLESDTCSMDVDVAVGVNCTPYTTVAWSMGDGRWWSVTVDEPIKNTVYAWRPRPVPPAESEVGA